MGHILEEAGEGEQTNEIVGGLLLVLLLQELQMEEGQ